MDPIALARLLGRVADLAAAAQYCLNQNGRRRGRDHPYARFAGTCRAGPAALARKLRVSRRFRTCHACFVAL